MEKQRPVASSKDVRLAEQQWAATSSASLWSLMVAAAESFVDKYLPLLGDSTILVAVGKGNNGGDGYYIAKILHEAGKSVRVWAPFGEPAGEIDANKARKAYLAAGGEVYSSTPVTFGGCIVDALFGSGLNRPLSDESVEAIQWINQQQGPVYSVDVPSGLHSDTGVNMGAVVMASGTHQFIALKAGTLTNEGPQCCGQVSLDTLGVTTKSAWSQNVQLEPLPDRVGNTHKSRHGNVRVFGGRRNMGGAALISAKAALRFGAGRVYVHCDQTFYSAVVSDSPELMIGEDWNRSENGNDCCVVGPGLGRDDEAHQWVASLVQSNSAFGVLDADALDWLARNPTSVGNWVLTPHEGEAARLLDVSSATVLNDRVEAALALSKKYGTVVVLKGAGTIVADGARLIFCHAGAPEMATPGMGDVLAGMIGSLLAQGLSKTQAAYLAVNYHAQIGAELAKTQRIVLASDVINRLHIRRYGDTDHSPSNSLVQ